MTQVMQAIKKVQGVASYTNLLRAVRLAMAGGRARAEQAVEAEKVRTSWEIGKLIDAHVLEHKERAGYAEQVLVRLAKDLGTSKTELYYMLEFARAYRIFPHAGKLAWSDYRDLLSVNDDGKRKSLAAQAAKEGWQRERLRDEVRRITRTAGNAKGLAVVRPYLTAQPGKVGTYRIIRAKAGPYAGELAVDLGFSNYLSLRATKEGKLPFQDRDIVIATQTNQLKPAKDASESDLFTYDAYVYQVIDGDTFSAVIDLGFGFVTAQTLRLRGLDAPEIMTADGRKAKQALEKRLTNHTSPILIRTTRSDKYDRYLVDIFRDGRYVNQELLAKGFATAV